MILYPASGGAPEAAAPAFTVPSLMQDRAVLGVALLSAPRYQGSDRYRLVAVPVIELRYGRFFANPRKGIGYQLVKTRRLTLSAATTYVRGYRQADTPAGIGRLGSGLGARVAVDYKRHGVRLSLGATKVLSGGVDGTLVDSSIAVPVPLSKRLVLMPAVSATWADRSYNDRYFGVTGAQSAASGLPVYHPGGGVKDVTASLAAIYHVNDRINLVATGALSNIVGGARNSPIVRERTQTSGVVSMTYRF